MNRPSEDPAETLKWAATQLEDVAVNLMLVAER